MSFKKALLAASLIAVSASASAAVISGNELQNGLNNITDGNFYDVNTSQVANDEVWTITSSGGSVNRLIFEFAGFSNVAEFGIYDVNNTANRVEIFNGASCGTYQCGSNLGLNFEVLANMTGTTYQSLLNGSSATFSSSTYGYYLNSGAGTFFSQAHLNTELGLGVDADHMVAYKGDDSTRIDITGGTNYKPFSSGEYILAWEDLSLSNSDYDYTDFVVLVESVAPVSEPGTLALLGLGILGLGFARRKQAKA